MLFCEYIYFDFIQKCPSLASTQSVMCIRGVFIMLSMCILQSQWILYSPMWSTYRTAKILNEYCCICKDATVSRGSVWDHFYPTATHSYNGYQEGIPSTKGTKVWSLYGLLNYIINIMNYKSTKLNYFRIISWSILLYLELY